jgi:hypothetical protein
MESMSIKKISLWACLATIILSACYQVPQVPQAPPIPPGSPTPKLFTTMSLGRIFYEYDKLTGLQQADFASKVIGQWVDWKGEVSNVDADGKINVITPGSYVDIAELNDVPTQIAIKLYQGQSIHFTGRIESVEYFIGATIHLREVQLLP